MIIYVIHNLINDKCYIGQTVNNNKRRLWTHKSKLRSDKHYNDYLQRSWNKYGEESFEFKILEEGFETIEELNDAETFWIKTLQTLVPYGYNMNYGGDNSLMLEISKTKLSESLYKYYENNEGPNKGIKQSEESNIKRRETILKGYEEGRIVGHWTGVTGEDHPNYGKERPYMKGDKNPKYWEGKLGEEHHSSIPIYQYDLDGNFIREWSCAAEVERKLGICSSRVRSVCRKERNTTGGFQWTEEKVDKLDYVHAGPKRRVIQLDKEGNFIKVWNSMSEAELNLDGVYKSNVSKCCLGKHETCGGYKWMYKEDYED